MAGLFASGLRTELEPDDVAPFRYACPRHYQTSLPLGAPASTSPCTFLSVILFTRSFSRYFLRFAGFTTRTPFRIDRWTSEPASTPATASNTLADADGLGAITYTWKADGSTIGTGSTYVVTEAEVGKLITVVASYTDGHGTTEAVSSASTAAVVNVNDAPTGSVTIDDTTPTQDQTLTASNTLADADGLGAITYTWKADGSTIGTGNSYILTEAEVGKVIAVVASYTDGHGTSESVSSAATAAVTNVNDAPTGSVTIDDTTPNQGQTLTASNTLADADGLGVITYTWKADGSTIGTGTTYVVTEAEVGKVITVVASYTDGHGTAEAVSSAATAAVVNVNDAPTGSVTIDDTTPAQGQTLTASNTHKFPP